ncbi:MAG: hypothetical protein KatS3mg059_0964 [Thermomicrobiales bacterium]|nr:MAG: hypothetical protein KatS3mg059_0964 [Thermomicrobiales bacterium]
MLETHLTYRTTIAAPAEDVRAWHGRPGAFERLVPPWMDVRVIAAHGTIQPGDWKELRLKLGPVPIAWKLVHEAGTGEVAFVDVQVTGPFRSWRHEHVIKPADATATVLEDRIRFQLPFPPFGPALAGGVVRRQLDRAFDFRHQRTRLDLDPPS